VGVWLLAIALLFLLMGAALQLLLPSTIAKALETALHEGLGGPEKLMVKVESFPAVEMLVGRVDALNIEASGGGTAGFNWSRIEMSVRDLRVDLQGLIARRQLNTDFFGQALAALYLSEQEMLNWVAGQIGGGVEITRLTLKDGTARFDCRIIQFGRTINFYVTGSFLAENHRLRFIPAKLNVEGVQIASPLVERMLGQFDLSVPVPQLPVGLLLVEAEVIESYLKLTARNKI
jgi:hypothetical protein